jgi:hypothetical protein
MPFSCPLYHIARNVHSAQHCARQALALRKAQQETSECEGKGRVRLASKHNTRRQCAATIRCEARNTASVCRFVFATHKGQAGSRATGAKSWPCAGRCRQLGSRQSPRLAAVPSLRFKVSRCKRAAKRGRRAARGSGAATCNQARLSRRAARKPLLVRKRTR